jgi:hypothetical protein
VVSALFLVRAGVIELPGDDPIAREVHR